MMTLEICTGNYNSVVAAVSGGAHRVELCSGLDEGGVTPSYGLIRAACSLPNVKKHVLIRPRGGDFLYTKAEKDIILHDIALAAEAGADGVVIGALNSDGTIDIPFTRACVDAAGSMRVTFHRAFDLCAAPLQALDDIIAAGCHRLLTSGQAATAEAGIPLIRQLVERAGNRLHIMPGCGVNATNARRILNETGAKEIHASARHRVSSGMQMRHDGVGMGKAGADEYTWMETSEDEVKNILANINGL